MNIAYRLNGDLRGKLKDPIGVLIRGSFSETMRRFREIMAKEKPSQLISVGDTVSRNLFKNNISPHVFIIDNLQMRKPVKEAALPAEETIYVKNPPATITEEAANAICDALKSDKTTKIVVNGEEDLLTLVAILYAPENSLVLYGQPREGIVVVKVTEEKRREIQDILREMQNARKTK
ncbi:MAG: GTP-dependent dephospho-CoA kinase family protein [Candidatus Bathyarchaeota archaeon]|nr:GTP-dependent dephospho-CoA kinase family protein [Candidatus Bathyarchaeota archaeon]